MGRYGKWIVVILGVVFVYITFTGDAVKASSKWENFDVRTEIPEGITADKVQERFRQLGHQDSAYYSEIDFIFEEGKRYGINPVFIIAKMNMESGWGKSSLARSNYNFGGIRTSENFSNAKGGISKQYDLIDKYMKGKIHPQGKKLLTFKDILNVYCPESDGCNHSNYIASVGSMMENFGQSYDGTLMSGTASDGELEATQKEITDRDGRPIPLGTEIYEMRPVVFNSIGVKTGDERLGQEKVNWFNNFSETSMQWLLRIGWVLSFGLMLYISMYIMAYVVMPRGTWYEKFFSTQMIEAGEDVAVQGFKGVVEMLKRGVIALGLMFLFGTGLYIPIMSFILTGLEKLTRWII